MQKLKETWQQATRKWKAGKTVWSAELGGIGPGYEQCIQILLWEILHTWGRKRLPKDDGNSFPGVYSKHVDGLANRLSKVYGFSGAQVGAAKTTAYQFMKYGYSEQMAKLPGDRWIQVSRNFPESPEAQ